MENTKQNNSSDEVTIDLVPIFRAWLKKWWLILIAMLLFGIATFSLTKLLVTPVYRSSFTVYVNNRTEQDVYASMSSSDAAASRSLAKTYAVIANSQVILERVVDKAGLVLPYEKLSKNISTELATDAEILTVHVNAASPQQARILAEALANALVEDGPDIVVGSSVKVIDKPQETDTPYSPKVWRNTAVGMFLGAFFVLAVLSVAVICNTKLTDASMLEKYGLPVLGTIPRQSDAEKESHDGYAKGHAKKRSRGMKNGK